MVTIRPADGDDAAALNTLMQASSAYHGPYRPMLEGYAITATQIERDHVFVAVEGGVALGFYSLIAAGEPELDLMFVVDAAQGRGLGRQLMAHMAGTARALGMASVKIISNPPAVGFYESTGAVRIGETTPKGRVTWTQPILRLDL